MPDQKSIEVKFNNLLFESARLASTFGIPTLAGVPLASSIFDISLDTQCAFFELFDSVDDVLVNLSISGEILFRPPKSKELDLIRNPKELVERVFEKCLPYDWKNVTENLRAIRRAGLDTGYGHPFFGPVYRPFHLLLID